MQIDACIQFPHTTTSKRRNKCEMFLFCSLSKRSRATLQEEKREERENEISRARLRHVPVRACGKIQMEIGISQKQMCVCISLLSNTIH